jgi:hypothetical protein
MVSNKVEEMLAQAQKLPGVTFVKAERPMEFSLSITAEAPPAPTTPGEPMHPFVPSSSFYYRVTEDTAFPKKTLETLVSDKLNLVKSFSAIGDIDWQQIEAELRKQGETLDVGKLQLELKKAIAKIDWDKLSSELEKAGEASELYLKKYRDEAAGRYLQFQKAKVEKTNRYKKAAEVMLHDRLHQPRPATPKSAKKIVEI